MTTQNIRLCVPTTQLDGELLALYEGSFPAAERESVERIAELLTKGRMLCHRSLNEKGELLCFTIVTLADNFSFLAYMATDPNRRSGGIGTKHLTRLIELLQESYPEHMGLFFEIEATDPEFETLSEEEKVIRGRRRAFYERAGARVICPDSIYLTVKYDDRTKEWEGELMGFEFGDPIRPDELTHLLEQIYMLCYQLPADHPLVQKVLAYFGPCIEPESDTQDDDDSSTPDSDAAADNCGCEARAQALREWWSWLKQQIAKIFRR